MFLRKLLKGLFRLGRIFILFFISLLNWILVKVNRVDREKLFGSKKLKLSIKTSGFFSDRARAVSYETFKTY